MLPQTCRGPAQQPGVRLSNLVILLFGVVIAVQAIAQDPPAPRAPYDPGTKIMQPRMFAADVVSADLDESGGVFSPDGRDFYFTVLASYTTSPRFSMICVSHFENGHWRKPETVSFSGRYMDLAPHLSVDGNRLFFTSIRPVPESKGTRFRIWVTERLPGGWAEPTPLSEPINQETSHNLDATPTSDGELYLTSDRDDSAGHFHIFRSRFVDGKFQTAQKLGPAINSDFIESSPAISPDGNLLVFASNASPENQEKRRPQDLIAAGKPYPRQDLYISVKRDGQWTPARHLEHGINSSAEEVNPSFSPDGKFLFWGSERSGFEIPTRPLTRATIERLWRGTLNGRGNIYFISVEALEAGK
jgi:Tol biopolymer transport system component